MESVEEGDVEVSTGVCPDSRAVFGLFVCKFAIDGTFYLSGLLQDLWVERVGMKGAKDEGLATAHRGTRPVQRLLETEGNMSSTAN